MLPTKPLEDTQKLDGPDYITVVLEWSDEDRDEADDEANDDNAPTMVSTRPLARAPGRDRTWLTVLGALSAIALTTWGLRMLKPA